MFESCLYHENPSPTPCAQIYHFASCEQKMPGECLDSFLRQDSYQYYAGLTITSHLLREKYQDTGNDGKEGHPFLPFITSQERQLGTRQYWQVVNSRHCKMVKTKTVLDLKRIPHWGTNFSSSIPWVINSLSNSLRRPHKLAKDIFAFNLIAVYCSKVGNSTKH